MTSIGDSPGDQTWTVRRVSLVAVGRMTMLLSLCLWVVVVVAAVVLWQLASRTGLLGNVESFWAEATGQDAVTFDGPTLLVVVVAGGLVVVGLLTVFHVLFAWLFNTMSSITGGIPVEVGVGRSRRSRPAPRRQVAPRPAPPGTRPAPSGTAPATPAATGAGAARGNWPAPPPNG